ncbi:hypothetical protein GALMADRAFT_239160 [Galerina marginata CBS 339.88]|uniref:Utp14-domain-containing protein n=1 Tax=Galerina marginata (strain CBS 339.88) TaxID=685588 RepID=A0A067TDV6_GALM3|nr:hypothetical protein GALMADRAFT_239160 [Galerina marginata CBS 339.88]
MNSSHRLGRFPTKKSGQSFGKSASAANAAGYEKRRARKKTTSTTVSDLYEYIPEKSRRSKVGLDLGRDEAFDYAVGLDDVKAEEREQLKARLIGENDDGEVASEDDDEIDSDAAFEESDEERFAGFFSAKKSKTKSARKQKSNAGVRFAVVDLNEDDNMDSDNNKVESDTDGNTEKEEQEDDGEFIDLLDVLDGKGEIDMGSDEDGTSKQPQPTPVSKFVPESDVWPEGAEEEDNEEESGGWSEDDEMEIVLSEDEGGPEALDQLQDFVANLEVTGEKRKAREEDGVAATGHEARSRRRRLAKEQTETGEENEFRAHSSRAKLNLDDLLAPLSSQTSALQSLKKSTRVLASYPSSIAKTLSAPLPRRTQERLDRQAAYEQTKDEVDKWSESMKHIREAEHLSFPLQAQTTGRVSNLELNVKFKPTTELETAVDVLLKSAKMREEDIHDTEDSMLIMNNLSVEEVAHRRAELRKMRELTFRAEIKARRVSKIKSKTYRKLKRKEKDRLGDTINEQEGSEDEEGKLKKELLRAKERATLRHKHTGKWARQMRNKEDLDENSRRAIEEMLARGEKLRRRVKGVGTDDEDESEGDEDDGTDLEGDIANIKQGAFDELCRLKEDDIVAKNDKPMGKSVFGMKFMKVAMARQSEASNREVDQFIKEMGGEIGKDEDEETQDLDSSSGILVSRTGGRLVFRPTTTPNHHSNSRPLASLASDTSSVTLKSTDLLSPPPPSPLMNRLSEPSEPPAQNSNPWLARGSSKTKLVKKTNEVVISKDSQAAAKLKNKVKKATLKRAEERQKAMDEGLLEVSTDAVLLSTSTAPPMPRNGQKMTATGPQEPTGQPTGDSDNSDIDLEAEAQEHALSLRSKGRANGMQAFKQRDLVALAFAGDNVVESFKVAKKQEIVSDAPREVDTTIPGWGSWGGNGTRKAPPKAQQIKKISGINPATRADYNKKNIIISEKYDKKARKYLVKDLPYPYTSKAQFEHAMEHPLGVEWNTQVAFQRGTLPRVVKKPGIIINPLEKQHS